MFLLPTLLIVTDHPSVRAFFKKHLDRQFFLLYAARREQAMQAMLSSVVDFVIVDANFEDCAALKLCAEIRSKMSAPTPMLLITGRLSKTFREQATEAGVTDFLDDQLDESELAERIEAAQ